jgi:hypothetical protein
MKGRSRPRMAEPAAKVFEGREGKTTVSIEAASARTKLTGLGKLLILPELDVSDVLFSEDTMFNPIFFEQAPGSLFNGDEGSMNGGK